MRPRSISTSAASDDTVFEIDQTFVMVSRRQGDVLAESAQPPQRSTTGSPFSSTAAVPLDSRAYRTVGMLATRRWWNARRGGHVQITGAVLERCDAPRPFAD